MRQNLIKMISIKSTPYIKNKINVRESMLKSMLFTAIALLLTSCFTGIESTKTVSLTREDKRNLQPTPEELYFQGVKPQNLSEWETGKEFLAADNRTILIFNPNGLPADIESANIGGKILRYEGIDRKLEPDGGYTASIIFSLDNSILRYDTSKPFDTAPDIISSDHLPMLIDLDMVNEVKELLSGNNYWIRTPLWYDEHSNRINGRKFIRVTINDVQPGNIDFPVRLGFTDEDGNRGWIFMNYGNSGTETRLFSNLFYLSDIRKKYPSISDEVWKVICDGNVAIGMTKLECKLSLGNPDDVNRGHDYSQTLDLWQYPNGTVLWFEDGLLTKFRR